MLEPSSPAQIPRLRLRRLSISVASGTMFSLCPLFELASYCGWTADLEHLQISNNEFSWGLGLVEGHRMGAGYRRPDFPSLRHLELYRQEIRPPGGGPGHKPSDAFIEGMFAPLLHLPALRSALVAVPSEALAPGELPFCLYLNDAHSNLLTQLTQLTRLVRAACAADQLL